MTDPLDVTGGPVADPDPDAAAEVPPAPDVDAGGLVAQRIRSVIEHGRTEDPPG